jgi:hypothetical protein
MAAHLLQQHLLLSNSFQASPPPKGSLPLWAMYHPKDNCQG